MTNDAIELHFKGAGITFDAKIAPGDTAEAERARKVATFLLDMVTGEPGAAVGPARKAKRPRAEQNPELLATTDPEAESL